MGISNNKQFFFKAVEQSSVSMGIQNNKKYFFKVVE